MPACSLASRAVSRAAGALMLAALAAPAHAATLFEDLGEQPGVTRIVDDLLPRVLADPLLKASFDDADIERLHGLLVLKFCNIAGGPCRYPGRDMKTSHAGLNLKRRHFNAMVEHLQDAMGASSVPFRTQNRLLALLAPMHRDIVTP